MKQTEAKGSCATAAIQTILRKEKGNHPNDETFRICTNKPAQEILSLSQLGGVSLLFCFVSLCCCWVGTKQTKPKETVPIDFDHKMITKRCSRGREKRLWNTQTTKKGKRFELTNAEKEKESKQQQKKREHQFPP